MKRNCMDETTTERAQAAMDRAIDIGSCWSHEVHDRYGNVKKPATPWHHNLTTDTASGYTNRRDWQAKLMGGGVGADASFVGSATATTATSLTASVTFPTSGQALAGMIVACGPNTSGVGATVWGVIVSNTATVLTVDQWYNSTNYGSVAATPNATCKYQILPGQAPAMYLALSTDSGAPSSADTFLQSEITTGGLQRAPATFAHTAGASTYTLTKVFNATATLTVNKEAVFNAAFKTANTNDGGCMPFESAEPSPPTLVSGDQLTQVVTITI